MSNKTIVVVGSGPGVGSQTAAHFASKGFNVALLSRNADRLKEDAATVKQAGSGVKVQTYSVDVGTHTELKKTLEKVAADFGPPEVVLFNAARVATSSIGEEPPEDVIQDFKIINIGLYVTATWAIPLLTELAKSNKNSHPSLLITGGGLWEFPLVTHFSLSMQKAAQVNLTSSLQQVLGPQGVHVATVNVGGIIQDSDPVINAKNIAATFYVLSQEEKSDWRNMVNLSDIRNLLPDRNMVSSICTQSLDHN